MIRRKSAAIKKADFLLALVEKCSVFHAVQVAGVGRRTVYTWREKDTKFAQAWDDAMENSLDALEASLYERAMNGDTVAGIFLLKGRRKHIFRDGPQAVAQAVTQNLIQVGDAPPKRIDDMTEEELAVAIPQLEAEVGE